MKVHEFYNKEDAKVIKEQAKKLGLDVVKNVEYNLYKTGAKNFPVKLSNPVHQAKGFIYMMGLEGRTWISVIGLSHWFKTSPILSCKKEGNIIKIETENSFYELRT